MTEEEKIIATLDGWELLRFHQLGGSVSAKQQRKLREQLVQVKRERDVPRPPPYVEQIKYTVAVGTRKNNVRGDSTTRYLKRMKEYTAARRRRVAA